MCKSLTYILFIIIIAISCDRDEDKPIDDLCSLFEVTGSFVYINNCSFSTRHKIDPRTGIESIKIGSDDGTIIEIDNIFYTSEGFAKRWEFNIDDGSFLYSGFTDIFRSDTAAYIIDSVHVGFLLPDIEDCYY